LDARFDLGFVTRLARARGNDDGAVVISQFLVAAVEPRFVTTGTDHSGLRIVWDEHPAHTTKGFVGINVAFDPSRRLFIGKSLDESVVAGSEHRDEQGGFADAPLAGVVDRNFLSRPVNEHLLPGFVVLTQDRIDGLLPTLKEFTEAAVAVTLGMVLPILLPQQVQGHAFAAQFLMDLGPLGQRPCRGWFGRCWSATVHQPIEQFFLSELLGQRPVQRSGLGSFEVIANRAGGESAAAGDFSHREPLLIFES